jgi:hypothetical protein
VDKIIIAQESIRKLCNTINPGSFSSIANINYSDLASCNMRFVGIYGNRDPVAGLLRILGVIDDEVYVYECREAVR